MYPRHLKTTRYLFQWKVFLVKHPTPNPIMHEPGFTAHLLLGKALALCLLPQPCPLGDLAQGCQGSLWQGLGAEPSFPGSWPGTFCHQTPQPLPLISCPLCSVCTLWRRAPHTPTSVYWVRCFCPTPLSSSAIWGIGNLAGHCPWGQAWWGGEDRPLCWSEICKARSLSQSFFFF